MQVWEDQHDAVERGQHKLKQELDKMSAWGDQIADLVTALVDLSEYFDKFAESRPPGIGVSPSEQRLRQLSDHSMRCTHSTDVSLWGYVAARPVF